MTKKKSIFTLQDVVHYTTRFVKYWKAAALMLLAGVLASLVYYTYGTPTFYSRSQVAFTNVSLPVKSETSDSSGSRKYEQMTFIMISALNSRWIIEKTAQRLGLVEFVGQYEEIRDKYVSSVKVGMLPGNILQIEVYAYQPWIVREWPEAMMAAYHDSTLQARAKHREVAYEVYAEEMKRLKDRINVEMIAKSKFEEKNAIIERYIDNNKLEAVPSEMLTTKNRLDAMEEVDVLLSRPGLTAVDKLSMLKKFRDSPVAVGTIMRQGSADALVSRSQSPPLSATAAMTSNAPQAPTGSFTQQAGGPSPVIVIPSMVEGLQPWESTERELRAALHEKEAAAKTYLPAHEFMRNLDKKIQQLSTSVDNELQAALNAFTLERMQLTTRLDELKTKMPDYRRILNDFDFYKQEFNLMSSGGGTWIQAYGDLQRRLSNMEFTGIEMKVDFDFQGFQLMRDDIPVSPNKSKLLSYALMFGFSLAVGTCFGLEKLKSTTTLVTETEGITGAHALGVVPFCSEADLVIPFSNQRSKVSPDDLVDLSETFRIVRCSIPLYVDSKNPCQVIMVTSSRASEGKTVVSSMLARSFADAGQKTLLIDADLRRGRVHRLLAVEQNSGLGGYLAGEVADLKEVIIHSDRPLLDFVTRGRESYPRYESLSSARFLESLDKLRKTYDRIIIDTPPLLGLADSIMISSIADGAVFVVRAAMTPQRDISAALEILERTRTPLFGFILNGVDLSKIENYYYYSSYYPKYYDPSYINSDETLAV